MRSSAEHPMHLSFKKQVNSIDVGQLKQWPFQRGGKKPSALCLSAESTVWQEQPLLLLSTTRHLRSTPGLLKGREEVLPGRTGVLWSRPSVALGAWLKIYSRSPASMTRGSFLSGFFLKGSNDGQARYVFKDYTHIKQLVGSKKLFITITLK